MSRPSHSVHGGPRTRRVPPRRIPYLKPRERRSPWGPSPSPPEASTFRRVQVLIPCPREPGAGAIVRALEAVRALAERGAGVLLVIASPMGLDADGERRKLEAVVRRFRFARIAELPTLLPNGVDQSGPHEGGSSFVVPTGGALLSGYTLCASRHACLDPSSVEAMMQTLDDEAGEGAVVPNLVGPDGGALPAIGPRGVPHVWMALTSALGSIAGSAVEPVDAAGPPLVLRRSRAANMLVPFPRDLTPASPGALERETLAT